MIEDPPPPPKKYTLEYYQFHIILYHLSTVHIEAVSLQLIRSHLGKALSLVH